MAPKWLAPVGLHLWTLKHQIAPDFIYGKISSNFHPSLNMGYLSLMNDFVCLCWLLHVFIDIIDYNVSSP